MGCDSKCPVKLENNIILTRVTRAILPLIVLFGLYVQMHGKLSAGGGFQAGVIVAAAFILYALVFGLEALTAIIPLSWQKAGACAGVLLYAGVGFFSLLAGGHFLDYNLLGSTGPEGQFIGIFLVEIGVGLTVCSVMLMMYCLFAGRKK